MTVKKRRKPKFLESLADGNTKKQAAIDAGVPEKSASQTANEMLKDPEIKKELADMIAERNLGPGRALDEVSRGLEKGRIGSHAEYLDKLLKLNKLIDAPQTNVGTNVLVQINAALEGRKIIE